MFISIELHMRGYRGDDHREDAPNFIINSIIWGFHGPLTAVGLRHPGFNEGWPLVAK